MRRIWFALLLLAAAVPSTARAQDNGKVVVTPDSMVAQLVLRDGSILVGRITEVTETTVRFASALGESTIPRSAIASVTVSGRERLRDGQLWPEDPSRTRLLFAP